MELSPAEEVLIGIVRGDVETDFVLTVARTAETVVVTLSSASDGVMIGASPSFDAALCSLCGVEGPAEPPSGGEAAPRPALRLVGGTAIHPETAEAA